MLRIGTRGREGGEEGVVVEKVKAKDHAFGTDRGKEKEEDGDFGDYEMTPLHNDAFTYEGVEGS